MPLDMRQTSLADLATQVGVTPIANDLLERHKVAEIEKHPGSWIYAHSIYFEILFNIALTFAVLGTTTGVTLTFVCLFLDLRDDALIPAVLGLVSFGIACVLISRQGYRTYGPGRWVETILSWRVFLNDATIPKQARDIVRLIGHDPDVQIVKGELVRNSVVLDPYLVMRRGDEQIVIAVWDDVGILHLAAAEQDVPTQLL